MRCLRAGFSQTPHVSRNSPPRRVALHAARRWRRPCGATPSWAAAREAAFRPVGADLDLVAAPLQLLDGGLAAGGPPPPARRGAPCAARTTAGSARCARPARRSPPAGSSWAWRRDLLRVAQEELAAPLVLLVAAGRAPAHVGLAVAQRHADRQRRARALARRQRGRQALLQPEHLPARAERPAERPG